MMDIDPQKIIVHPYVPGAVGAAIGLKFSPGNSWVERATNVASGWACSLFITPIVVEFFKIRTQGFTYGLSFLIGLFGLSIMAAMFDGLRQVKFGEIITGWLSKK